MRSYCLPAEGQAYELEQRWLACSEPARYWTAMNLGRFPFGTLPHVIAEAYDRDELAVQVEASGYEL